MNITKGKVKKKRKVLLYGTHGIGKSTFANDMPNPIFIQTEDGLSDIDVHGKFDLAKSYSDIEEQLGFICKEKHDYETLVIDTIDWLEQLTSAKVCEELNIVSLGDLDHGKGYVRALEVWKTIVGALEFIQKTKNMHIVLLAHSKVAKFDDPDGESYDRYSPKLQKGPNALVQEFCDEVFFAKYKVLTKTVQEGFSKKQKPLDNQGERVIFTQERPAFYAKNRLSMPLEIPFTAKAYLSYLTKGN